MDNPSSRRKVIKNMIAGSAALLTSSQVLSSYSPNQNPESPLKLKGNINHSVCRWCYDSIPFEDFCQQVKAIGLNAIDLVAPKDWPLLQKYGLYSSMCYVAGDVSLTQGFADTANHSKLIAQYLDVFPLMVKAGYKDVICFSGSRAGMDNETGWNNCVKGLKAIMPSAEQQGITVHMELLNSRVDHKDYMCDHTPWGVELCKRLRSPNFKLLYDIYHMQIDEGDVIRTIRDNHEYLGHYHTGGVPGRHEIDETQELYYPAIMKAILATGFKGYVAQEFIPEAKDKIDSLSKAVRICDI
ncbi:MAG: TIM barrel protein [Bacteroidota bacterium]|nr:TIM barrel protein [Bacteroidota bacterium]MDP4248520.1 TIM barrel protein [Bacteroidota bacterium]